MRVPWCLLVPPSGRAKEQLRELATNGTREHVSASLLRPPVCPLPSVLPGSLSSLVLFLSSVCG